MSEPEHHSSPANQQWRDQVRRFAEEAISPLSTGMDRTGELDPGLREQLFAAGLMSVEIPRGYGGTGGTLLQLMLAIEEIARVDPGVAVGVDVHNVLVAGTLLRHATGDQRRQYLPLLATAKVGAFALSEEQAGSDAFALTTTARPDGDGYRITGRKRWTSNARNADLLLAFALVEDSGPTAFLVPADAAGLSVEDHAEQMGVRAAHTADVVFDGTPVRAAQRIGSVGGGQTVAMAALDLGRLGIAAQLVGLAQGALDLAVAYSRSREQFGSRIADYQGVQFPLADAASQLAAARALLYESVDVFQRDTDAVKRMRFAAMAKYTASQIAERAASVAVETLGGNGFTDAYPAERLYRDAKAGKIYEGTSNVLLRNISSIMLGVSAGD
ncbi:acyl-CoA dehydrogenase family protein [Saccharopolyspora indica]|uniref:acyl-CoA dehydrogenase family protein n=1 Tax=Saccharopolyspora indica TaxID=1229659 RepID=UPI0022EA2AB7|nr:acyl-CoA dehydrogenase family protein [Saccharopolyspora indica]MDA3648676.1 acyl-CoA dehydrogenase family protein [Saccharopolyspora indica]